jgi:hypothetical protein
VCERERLARLPFSMLTEYQGPNAVEPIHAPRLQLVFRSIVRRYACTIITVRLSRWQCRGCVPAVARPEKRALRMAAVRVEAQLDVAM